MLSHLVYLVDGASTSFCHYDNPSYGASDAALTSLETMQQVVAYANERDLSVNFVYGQRPLSSGHEQLVEQVPHARIVPLALASRYPDACVVVNPCDSANLGQLSPSTTRNVIVRASCADAFALSRLVSLLEGRGGRLTIVLLGLDTATDDQLEMYRAAVQSLGEYVYRRYVANQSIELNVVSDRLMLRQMRNCNAGIDHLTVSPSGQFYLCPGFFHSQGLEYVGGTLATGPELRNNRLLELGNAPICRTCDAWHCKRCVWLNQRATLEVNTPSRQQCVAAHLERAVSHELRERLVAQDAAFGVFPPIGAGESLDPFDRVGARPTKKRIVSYPGAQTAAQSPTERQPADSNRDLLLEILRKQDEILALLKRQGAES